MKPNNHWLLPDDIDEVRVPADLVVDGSIAAVDLVRTKTVYFTHREITVDHGHFRTVAREVGRDVGGDDRVGRVIQNVDRHAVSSVEVEGLREAQLGSGHPGQVDDP